MKRGRPPKFTRTKDDGTRVLAKGYRRIQCFIPAEVVKGLKLIGAKKEMPFSGVVGEALASYVKRYKV